MFHRDANKVVTTPATSTDIWGSDRVRALFS